MGVRQQNSECRGCVLQLVGVDHVEGGRDRHGVNGENLGRFVGGGVIDRHVLGEVEVRDFV